MSKSYRSDPRNHISRTLEIISVGPQTRGSKDFRGWISANGFSKSALIKQRTSHVKLPKIVILFDEQITFSKTLCKQAFLPISFARKYYGTIRICSHLPIFNRLTFQYCSIITPSLGLVGSQYQFYQLVLGKYFILRFSFVGHRYGSNAAVLNTPSVA